MLYRHRRTGRTVKVQPGSRHQRQLGAHRGFEPVPQEPKAEREPEADVPEDGVRHSGGPWFEVVVDGEVVDKVQGREAAEDRYAQWPSSTEGDG